MFVLFRFSLKLNYSFGALSRFPHSLFNDFGGGFAAAEIIK